jgi:glycosyltransferase involved in cell wall biosynthesis
LPSLWEGLSIALLEAMAMKKAIVVTPTDGTKEIIKDGYNGLVVDYSDPQKLADAYKKYVDSLEKKTTLGDNAYKLINERFSSQRVANEVFKIYKDVLL